MSGLYNETFSIHVAAKILPVAKDPWVASSGSDSKIVQPGSSSLDQGDLMA
jgi:hypothetical protein